MKAVGSRIKPKLYEFRGKHHTVTQIAALTGKSKGAIYSRLERGYSLDGPVQRGPKPQRIMFRGELKTFREIEEITGLSRGQVVMRHDGKHFFEDDELRQMRLENNTGWRAITFNGITDTIRGWANRTGINEATLYNRLRAGWSVETAITKKTLYCGNHPRYITFRGVTDTLAGWARRIGVSHYTLRDRLTQYGWSIERALTAPVMTRVERLRLDKSIGRLVTAYRNPPRADAIPSASQTGVVQTFH